MFLAINELESGHYWTRGTKYGTVCFSLGMGYTEQFFTSQEPCRVVVQA